MTGADRPFAPDEAFARRLDDEDPLSSFRDRFCLPAGRDGEPLAYFAGNSLGLMPKSARALVDEGCGHRGAGLERRLGLDGGSRHRLLRGDAAVAHGLGALLLVLDLAALAEQVGPAERRARIGVTLVALLLGFIDLRGDRKSVV